MTSSFSQLGEKLPQELFSPSSPRTERVSGRGRTAGSFQQQLCCLFPAGPLTWKRRSAWSLFPSPLLLPSLQPSPLGLNPVLWAWGWRFWLLLEEGQNSLFSGDYETRNKPPKGCKINVRPKAEDYHSPQHTALVPKSSCYTKFAGNKQHDTLMLWIPTVSSLHTLAEWASELGGLTLPGSCELP